MVGCGEGFRAHVLNRGDALADTGAIANQQEMNLAARTPIVEPSTQRYFFATMATQSIDIDPRHGSSLGPSARLIENRAPVASARSVNSETLEAARPLHRFMKHSENNDRVFPMKVGNYIRKTSEY